MARIFGRGELKEALVLVLADLGEAHGYGILNELKSRVGDGWKPSPGAIYPALLALVDSKLVTATEVEGVRLYTLSKEGQRWGSSIANASRWKSLSTRARKTTERQTVGTLLDQFADGMAVRRLLPAGEQRSEIESILARAGREIEQVLRKGDSNG